jgi:type IV pilus assembly protein PilM
MAKRSTTFTGLEIEPSAVHAAGVVVNGSISVRHAALAELEAGVVRDGEVQDVDALSEVLRELFREHKELDKRVRVGIANSKIVVRVIELPPISDPKELESAVRFQAQDELPMPLDSAVLDHQPLELVDTPAGPRQRVALVAARRDMVERVVAAVRGAGLRCEGIDLAAFGMVRALHRHAAPGEAVVYLSVGGLTNLAVATGTTCHFTRVVGGGLEALAVELAERRALTLEQARARLAHTGLRAPVEELGNGSEQDALVVEDARAVLVDGVRRIAGEVRNSVDFHHGQGSEDPIARVVLTGPAAGIDGFAEALSAELALPVEPGRVEAPPGLDAERLTVAAGLAVAEAVA